MILRRFYDDRLAQASFLVGCARTGDAIVIDPNRDIEQYLQAAQAERLRISGVTETHIHADFVSGTLELADATRARIYVSDEGGPDWKYGFANDPGVIPVRNGSQIRAGNVRLDVMATPGHTPEHIAFVLTDEAAVDEPIGIFTGDFVFVGDVGRPDLLERVVHVSGSMEQGARALFNSLERLRQMPGHLMLWPGHGAGSACGKSLGGLPVTTLAYERVTNWALRCKDVGDFLGQVLAGQPDPPPYFRQMKRLNQQGPPLLGGFRVPPRIDGVRVPDLVDAGALVVDTRPSAEHAEGAIPGALHIPLNSAFTTWAGWLLPYDRPIHLIAPSEPAVRTAVRELAMIGLDRVDSWAGPDALEAWVRQRGPLERLTQVAAPDAWARVQRGEWLLLDVRAANEYGAGHVPLAKHVPLGELPARAADLPRDRPIAVACGSGARSPIALSVLRRAGHRSLVDVREGFDGHTKAGLPVERGSVGAYVAPIP